MKEFNREGLEWVRNRDSVRFRNVRFDEDCCPQAEVSGVPLPDLAAHPLDCMWSVATFDAIAHGSGGVRLLSCGRPGPPRRTTESCVRRDGRGCHAAIIRRRLQELAAEIEQRSADLDSGWTWPDLSHVW
jgi:hypothetical protein